MKPEASRPTPFCKVSARGGAVGAKEHVLFQGDGQFALGGVVRVQHRSPTRSYVRVFLWNGGWETMGMSRPNTEHGFTLSARNVLAERRDSLEKLTGEGSSRDAQDWAIT